MIFLVGKNLHIVFYLLVGVILLVHYLTNFLRYVYKVKTLQTNSSCEDIHQDKIKSYLEQKWTRYLKYFQELLWK